MAVHEQSLVDQIYEAGLVPELWPDVIGGIALFGGCYGGSLFSVHRGGSLALATPDCRPHVEVLLQERWSRCNIRAERLLARRHPGFLTDRDVCSDEEIRTHPIYVDFLRPRGLGWTAATCIAGAPGDVAILSIDQLDERGPIPPATIELLDGLRPHIARAAMVSAQLQMERLRGWLHGLEALNVAAAIDARGRVKASNRRFEDLAPKVATGAFDALSIADAGASALFREALDGLKNGQQPRLPFDSRPA